MTKKIKIGILTFHFSDNFGAALQAYALRKWLSDEGHEADFVNYVPTHVEHGGSLQFGISKKVMMANAKVIYLAYSAFKSKFFGDKSQKNAFSEFRKNQLGVKSESLTTLAELNQHASQYDLLVCGSDQIWSPSVQRGLDPAYFLNFGKGPRKVSYAASFGNATLDSLRACDATTLLNGLDAIAVREKSGLELVKSLTNTDPTMVCDPTCLVESYEALVKAADEKRKDHIFCYALRTDQGVREVALQVAAWEGRELVSPANPHSRWRSIGTTVYPDPANWMALIKQSKFVVTNSFHGTMFAILFQKPFIVVGLPGKKSGLNDRMLSVLAETGLSNRFLSADHLGDVKSLWQKEIDWDATKKRLQSMREPSFAYLRTQINLASSK